MSDATQENAAAVQSFLETVEHPVRHADALALDEMFRRITGWGPKMWGPTIIGYGSYDYTYETGHSGTSLATGFSPRKANLSIYVMPGYATFGDILNRLGKHKMGKACLYINKLADIDIMVLEELVRAGLDDLATRWTISET